MGAKDHKDDPLKFLEDDSFEQWPEKAARAARMEAESPANHSISSRVDDSLRARMRSARPVPLIRRGDFWLGVALFLISALWLSAVVLDYVPVLAGLPPSRVLFGFLTSGLGALMFLYFRRSTDPFFRWSAFAGLHALVPVLTGLALLLMQRQESAYLFLIDDARAIHAAPEAVEAAKVALKELRGRMGSVLGGGPALTVLFYSIFLLPFALRRADFGFILRGLPPVVVLAVASLYVLIVR